MVFCTLLQEDLKGRGKLRKLLKLSTGQEDKKGIVADKVYCYSSKPFDKCANFRRHQKERLNKQTSQ